MLCNGIATALKRGSCERSPTTPMVMRSNRARYGRVFTVDDWSREAASRWDAVPDPDKLKKAIDDLNTWRQDVIKRREKKKVP